jgi:hypothetical protein
MAESPAHRFGQIVGEIIEQAVEPLLSSFAKRHSLYLDKKGARPCRKGRKCRWTDYNGNKHDLDFVLERHGSSTKQGMPVAFIEAAWRRYTKHSRNKVQEIQRAIEPLAETYHGLRPFKGAILAGDFTPPALEQLRSLGFTVLWVPYKAILSVFQKFGIDASSQVTTPRAEFQKKVDAYLALSARKRQKLADAILKVSKREVEQFFASLEKTICRTIECIEVLPLHGRARDLATITEALNFILNYREDDDLLPIVRYEIRIRYSNADLIQGQFTDKQGALDFLHEYQLPQVETANRNK